MNEKYKLLKEHDFNVLATRIDDLAFGGWRLMGPVAVLLSGNLISPYLFVATMMYTEARVAAIATANGFVPAADCEALKAKLAEVTDQLKDATDTLDQIESESHLFHATAIASGYVRLEPGQVVVTMTLVYAAKFRMDEEILRGEETNFEAYNEATRIIKEFESKEARDGR